MKCLREYTIWVKITVICISLFYFAGCAQQENTALKETAVQETKKQEETEVQVQVPSDKPITEERIYYDFENNLGGWEIPMWASGKSDYMAKDVIVSQDVAIHGNSSMKISSDFLGGTWAAALVEIQQYLDLSPYRVISADVYIPQDAPMGLKAKIILTVGSNWKFVEMSRSVPLLPGEWVSITANIEPGSYDWKRIIPDEEFAEDIRKIAVRIESNKKPAYTGPIYIDKVRCGR
ncbi:MAG: hypothetical protein ABH869_03890 [Candidatus Omnitrophota bacterium]